MLRQCLASWQICTPQACSPRQIAKQHTNNDSELSDPGSNITLAELENEFVMSRQRNRAAPNMPSWRQTSGDNADKGMEDWLEEPGD